MNNEVEVVIPQAPSTESGSSRAMRALLVGLFRAVQGTKFGGDIGYDAVSTAPGAEQPRFPQAAQELARIDDFFTFFKSDVKSALRGKSILDFGCGYGGRTVGYATKCGAAEVVGVEVYPNVLARCTEFAESLKLGNVRFLLSTQDRLPLPDARFDAIVTYDVLEHVADPVQTMRELNRVLKPGGRIFAVFTPFYGAMSHHLNYVAKIPGLHWAFSAKLLVDAANDFLNTKQGTALRTRPTPPAKRSFGDRRWCPPSLNGMTLREFFPVMKDFRVVEFYSTPLLERFRVLGPVGVWLTKSICQSTGLLGEALSFNVSCILEKPAE